MDHYPVLRMWTRHGHTIALIVAAALLILSFWAAQVSQSLFAMVVGAFASLCAYGGIRSYAELVKLVTDMLVPKIDS
jgi:hypothetical protein